MTDTTVETTQDRLQARLDVALGNNIGGDISDYVELLKPRVMFLVIFTALVGLVVAPVPMHPVLAIAALANLETEHGSIVAGFQAFEDFPGRPGIEFTREPAGLTGDSRHG